MYQARRRGRNNPENCDRQRRGQLARARLKRWREGFHVR